MARYAFFGTDTALLRHEVGRWKARFESRYGAAFLSHIRAAANTSVTELTQEITSGVFLGEKRLVILEGFLAKASDKTSDGELAGSLLRPLKSALLKALTEQHDDVMVLFVEANPDESDELGTFVVQNTEVRRFDLPKTEADVATRVQAALDAYNVEPSVERLIAERLAKTPERLAVELERLALYAASAPLTREIVLRELPTDPETTVFAIQDALLAGNGNAAVRALRDVRQTQSAFMVLSVLISQIRKTLFALECFRLGLDDATVAKNLDLKPFAIKKYRSAVRYREKLKNCFLHLAAADVGAKTGALAGSDSEWALTLALERALLGSV